MIGLYSLDGVKHAVPIDEEGNVEGGEFVPPREARNLPDGLYTDYWQPTTSSLLANCGGKGGKPGPCPAGGEGESQQSTSPSPTPSSPSSQEKIGDKMSQLSAMGAQAPAAKRKIIDRISAKVQSTYEKLERRYGRKGAIAVMAGIAVTLPIPIPGTTLVPIGIAEGIRGIGKLLSRKTPSTAVSNAELTPENLVAEAKALLADAYSTAEEDMPRDVDERLAQAIEHYLTQSSAGEPTNG